MYMPITQKGHFYGRLVRLIVFFVHTSIEDLHLALNDAY